ncbi:MAG TPA: ABC transporter substrate-binding protein [Bdellovibrionota bacterium]|nr:ABC transporter substrate-binding protein [Bdellovibrionota bacterium]
MLALAACTGAPDEPRGVYLHAASDFDLQTWDPALAYDETALEVLPAIFETLFQYDYLAENPRLKPLLAAGNPTTSRDRKILEIPILSGVRYHADPCFGREDGKGRELVASDFVFALKRLAMPSLHSPGWWLLGRRIEGMRELRAELEKLPPGARWKHLEDADVAGLQAPTEQRLRIRFEKPFFQVVHLLAQTFTAPLAPECARAKADVAGAVFSPPIGTGPFRLKEWVRGGRIVLERNPDRRPEYYPTDGSSEFRTRGWLADAGKPLPLVDGLIFEIFPDKAPAWASFLKGRVDALRIPKDQVTHAITNEANLSPELESRGARLSIEPGSSFSFLLFNMRDPIVGKNKLLRQAISSAIDRGKWIELFAAGRASKMTSLWPPGLPEGRKTGAIKYDFDLARARALMKRAGYPGGKGLPPLGLELRGSDGYNRQLGEFLSRQLAQVGVQLHPMPHDFGPFLHSVRSGKFQLASGNWEMDYPDPLNVAELLYGANAAPGPNLASFNDARVNSLYEKLPGSAAELDAIVQEEVPWVYGFHYAHYTVTQPWVRNFRAHGLTHGHGMLVNKWKYVRVDGEAKARYLEGQ